MKFFEQWDKLENLKAKVLLKHSLFGHQLHNCEVLHIINDNRIGVVLKGQEIFVDKGQIMHTEVNYGMYTVSDGRLQITVFVNKQ